MIHSAKTILLAGLAGLALGRLTLPARAAQPAVLPAQLPLFFEANQGQAGLPAQFIARGHDYQFLISPAAAQIILRKANAQAAVVHMQFVGANPQAQIDGNAELPGKINYLTGSDPARWHTGVTTFGKVRVAQLYPGINLIYYGNQQSLEYDFDLAPGVAPETIAIHFDGADKISVNARGDLVLNLAGGEIRQPKPMIYQTVAGARKEIAGGYRLADAQTITFAIGKYDHSLPLVIDPVLGYSTYFGGTSGETAFAVAVDTNGFVYMTGQTLSSLFAAGVPFSTSGVFQTNFAGGKLTGDAFVSKINKAGKLVFQTYLGGSADDSALGIAIDSAGDIYLTGFTDSPDFPVTTNALFKNISGKFDSSFGGFPVDAFVTEVNTNGTGLIYSTYLGGSATDSGMGIAVDSSNNAYVTGFTYSSNFPTVNALQNQLACTNSFFFNANGFVAKIGAGGSPLVYSTYFGGNNFDQGKSIAVDNTGNAYVTGFTASTNFPTANAVVQELTWTNVVGTNQILITNSLNGRLLNGSTNRESRAFDAFVAEFDPTGTNLIYSTYLGGTNNDFASHIAVDTNGAAYVTGWTVSTNFPNTAGLSSFVATNTRPGDIATNVFLTKITNGLISSTQQVGIAWSAVFGGRGVDVGYGVAVDPAGDAVFVTGAASSTNIPIFNLPGFMTRTNSGKSDAFVTAFTANATDLTGMLYSAYLGGKENDIAYAIALDALTNAYVVGLTASTDFPTFSGQFTTRNGTNDAFLSKITLSVPPPELGPEPQGKTNQVGSRVTFSISGTTNDNFPPYFEQWQYGTNLVGGTNLVDATNLVNGGNISGATSTQLAINPAQTTNSGFYQVILTNYGGSVTSDVIALLVTNVPASITVPPASQTNGLGSTAILTVTAAGTTPLSYQWQLEGTNVVNDSRGNHITGATSNVLTINNVQLTNGGNYTVIVTNINNAVTSSVAVLTIQRSPIITVQPISQTNRVGSTMTLTITAIGTVPLHFRWQYGTDQVNWTNVVNGGRSPGSVFSGATSNTLTITNVQTTNSFFYSAVVTNVDGLITSSVASLLVTNVPPAITSVQPTNQLVGVGTTASLSVTATGTAPLHYQWQVNGVNLANGGSITGATNVTLKITNVQTNNSSTNYTVIVTNIAGAVTSSPAILTVQDIPVFTLQPKSQTNSVGATIILTATNVGTVPLHYQWQYGTNQVNWKNLANGGLIRGATTNSLSITNAQTTNSGFYQLTVTNIAGSVTSSVAALLVTNIPPAITTQPTNRTVLVGSNVTLAVIATGTAPLHYQWLLNGTNLANDRHGGHVSGVTTSALKINNAAATNSGNYSVIITNAGGSVTSSVATLTVTLAPVITQQPTNRDVAVGSTAILAVTAVGTPPLSYQWLNGSNFVTGATSNLLKFVNAQTTNDGSYTVIVTNHFGSVTSSIAVLTVTNVPPSILVQPTSLVVPVGSNATLSVTAAGTPPLSYQWSEGTNLVDGATNSLLTFTNAQPTNSGNYSVTVTNLGGSVTSSNALLTVTNFPPTILVQPTNRAVAVGSNVTLAVVASGTPPLNYQWLEGTNLMDGATNNLLTFANAQTTNSGTYSVVVTNMAGSVTSSVAILTVASSPIILVQPTDQSMAAGSTATLVVTAVGIAPLSYQWSENANPLNGATNNVLTFINAQTTNSGTYSVVVTNLAGSATSSNAVLTVTNIPPAILVQPTNRAVAVGSNVTLVVIATGTAPLNYQWLEGTNLVDGATNNLLTFANAQTTNSGSYSVTVTNFGGSVTSAVATLTVASSPIILVQPTNRSLAVGSTATLVVTAVGIAPLSYQWLLDDTNLVAGATNTVLTIPNAQTTNSGNYSVTVTNSAGSVTSSNALLTVTNVPPAILVQPTNQTVTAGTAAILAVVATGTAPLSYQWLEGTNALNGATTNVLTFGNVQTNNNGFYSVVVTNFGGSVTSSVAALTVIDLPPSFGQIATANGGGFVLSGTGGLSNGTYYVLVSSNLVPGSWTSIATNQFDGSGNFIFTNTAQTNAPQLFFWLRLP